LFGVGRELETPTDAMQSSENDAEESEYNHARPTVTLCDGSIEGWNVGSIRDRGRCDDGEDGGEYE
jgi:hypothetical protein